MIKSGAFLFSSGGKFLQIERAFDEVFVFRNVRVNLRRTHVFVSEQFLHGANVVLIFEQTRREAVAKRVTIFVFVDGGLFGANDAFDMRQFNVQNIAVKKQKREQRLILRRSRNFSAHRQIGQKSRDFLGAHFFRMMFVMKQNKTLDKIMIRVLRPVAEMSGSGDGANLIEQFNFLSPI